jgi:hypothetical protein
MIYAINKFKFFGVSTRRLSLSYILSGVKKSDQNTDGSCHRRFETSTALCLVW